MKELVLLEAALLRQNTTDEEKLRLRSQQIDFNADMTRKCIYGLLTGHCYNERAVELRRLSKVWVDGDGYSPIEIYVTRSEAKIATLISYLTGDRETLIIDDL